LTRQVYPALVSTTIMLTACGACLAWAFSDHELNQALVSNNRRGFPRQCRVSTQSRLICWFFYSVYMVQPALNGNYCCIGNGDWRSLNSTCTLVNLGKPNPDWINDRFSAHLAQKNRALSFLTRDSQ
jgi:hypothetical protein